MCQVAPQPFLGTDKPHTEAIHRPLRNSHPNDKRGLVYQAVPPFQALLLPEAQACTRHPMTINSYDRNQVSL